MVAYSFKRRFVTPINLGLATSRYDVLMALAHLNPDMKRPEPKQQTIRADRKRHARPGEEIQLYCGMRTKDCFLIGKAVCRDIKPISLTFGKLYRGNRATRVTIGTRVIDQMRYLDGFARSDGFHDWADLRDFWWVEHPTVREFKGVIIYWVPMGTYSK